MKNSTFIACLLFAISSVAYADQNLYDQNGASRGRIDNNGNMYDKNGGSRGCIDNNGNRYDQNQWGQTRLILIFNCFK